MICAANRLGNGSRTIHPGHRHRLRATRILMPVVLAACFWHLLSVGRPGMATPDESGPPVAARWFAAIRIADGPAIGAAIRALPEVVELERIHPGALASLTHALGSFTALVGGPGETVLALGRVPAAATGFRGAADPSVNAPDAPTDAGHLIWGLFRDGHAVAITDAHDRSPLSLLTVDSHRRPANLAVAPAFPPGLATAPLALFIDPQPLLETLDLLLTGQAAHEYRRLALACARTARKAFGEANLRGQRQPGPLPASFGTCPLGGHYRIEALPPDPAAPGFRRTTIRCDHPPFVPPASDTLPTHALGAGVTGLRRQLLGLRPLTGHLDLARGELVLTLPLAGVDREPFPRITDPDPLEPALPALAWFDAREFRLPISEAMSGMLILGWDPDLLAGILPRDRPPPAAASGSIDERDRFPPGICIFALPDGGSPSDGFGSRGLPRLIIGWRDPHGHGPDLLRQVANVLAMRGGPEIGTRKVTREIDGADWTVLPLDPFGFVITDTLSFFHRHEDGWRIAALGRHAAATWTRARSEEDPVHDGLPIVSARCKVAGAINLAHLGHSLSELVAATAWTDECARCHDRVAAAVRRLAELGEGREELLEVPAELATSCPRRGLMIRDRRLFCSVHGQGRRRPVQMPTGHFARHRWLVFGLNEADGHATLAIRIVATTEVPR